MPHVLSFDIVHSTTPLEFVDGNYELITVTAKVDGRSPFQSGGDLFDALEVLAQGTEPGELFIYTCSCGVSECAGIWDETRLESDACCVRWRLPRDPFDERLDARWPREGGEVVIEFERTQYEKSLAGLLERLEALASQYPQHWAVAPMSGPSNLPGAKTVTGLLARIRQLRREYEQRHHQLKEQA